MLDEGLESMLLCSVESSFSKTKANKTKQNILLSWRDSYSPQVSCEHIRTTVFNLNPVKKNLLIGIVLRTSAYSLHQLSLESR